MIDASGPVGFDGFVTAAVGTGGDIAASIFGISMVTNAGLTSGTGGGRPTNATSAMIESLRDQGRSLRPLLAWYGDMELAPHLWHFAGLGRVKVVVEFHPPVTIDQFGSRKALADHCRQAIGRGVAEAIAGRPQA